MAMRGGSKYGQNEEGQCGHENLGSGEAGHRTISGDESTSGMSAGDNLGLSQPRGLRENLNFKMSSSDPISESGKQA
jgi:hypothetical protein